jgi:malate dehydrogenase (oxaloacetate-decarboxylating)
MTSDERTRAALALHHQTPGKLSISGTVPLKTPHDLSLAYTPGVAAVSQAIADNPVVAREYTIKRNTVAVVTDGSSVLGLGNIGPLAALPVMEGKAAIFKEFGGVDAFPICLDTQDTEEIIKAVKQLAPTFGGINLEDIAAPRCFEIEERLRKELSIPVMHDDQWGTATVVLAGLINALKLRGLDAKDVRIVLSGVGAAGVAIGRILHDSGMHATIFCDSKGIIHAGRDDLTKEKRLLLDGSSLSPSEGTLADALQGAHVFIGVSRPGVLTADMVRSMAERPILFTLANPVPEIMPDEAKAAGAFIVATGRSDFPNQINNSLVFPALFKAVLDADIKQFSQDMFIAAAHALAASVQQPSVESIIPSMFDQAARDAVYHSIVPKQ